MRQLIITALVLAFSAASVCADEDARPSDAAIEEAVTILEARMAQTENKEDKDKITKAISELNKLLPKGKKEGAEAKADADADLSKVITPARLRKKLAGRATFNAKTGELTLVYNFSSKDQLKDFDLMEAKPAMKAGLLRVGPADVIRHIVKFQAVKVTGRFAVENFSKRDGSGSFSSFLQTTGGAAAGTGDRNGLWIALNNKEKSLGLKTFPFGAPVENILIPVEFSASPKKATLKFHDAELAGALEPGAAGQVELLGALGGVRVQSLVISGAPDSEWAKEFFKD